MEEQIDVYLSLSPPPSSSVKIKQQIKKKINPNEIE